MAELKDVILNYIREEYIDEEEGLEISYDSPLISEGIVDSFSMVSLKRFLETNYKIQIPDAKASSEAFNSVNNIVCLLNELGIK
jgi:acyl carrier protein